QNFNSVDKILGEVNQNFGVLKSHNIGQISENENQFQESVGEKMESSTAEMSGQSTGTTKRPRTCMTLRSQSLISTENRHLAILVVLPPQQHR
ncbi:hypothetical protein, partial [Klebsiella pneumoniae]|uniref:hypothetical protein n=1 Tax=Klebsiella pneumoniae TaxID=573 RepID=UPI001BE1084E